MTSDPSASFALNDAVFVRREDGRQLEGVVAYLGGSVEENNNEKSIGVRLTGASIGLGEHEGSLEGKEYFSCPPNCGLFVRSQDVSKRQLSKLEELRLKRELAKTAAAATTASSATRTTRSSASASSLTPTTKATASPVPSSSSTSSTSSRATLQVPSLSNKKETAPAVVSSSTSPIPGTSPLGASSKLEELRQRRAALTERKEKETAKATTTTQVSSENTSTSSSSSTMEQGRVSSEKAPLTQEAATDVSQLTAQVVDLQQTLESLQNQLHDKDDQRQALQDQLQRKEHEFQTVLAKQQQQQQQQIQITSSSSRDSELQGLVEQLQSQVSEYKEQAQDTTTKLQQVTRQLQSEQQSHTNTRNELSQVRIESTTLKQELQAFSEQQDQRGSTDLSHFKERAKWQADIATHKRKIEQLESEKMDMEATIEDLTLDKEQLLEEKEHLEDKVEELKLDVETAQMEVEELKMEVEDLQASSSGGEQQVGRSVGDAVCSGGAGTAGMMSSDAEEMTAALSTQNARLREALIRLREQTQVEKMDLARQLREAEKDANTGRGLVQEVESLRAIKLTLEEQVNDLKDMVEQGSASEKVIEEMSDRLLTLEEDNINLQTMIREMEEAAELTAEMEEVQADELKALSRDLEERDTLVHNLEEAIKIQRRREEDFLRTVGNYRTTVATLNQEKKSLLELLQGGEGEKSNLMAASQGALARASQLVSDAAAVRRREALAVLDTIDMEVYKHLSLRLESLLPPNVASLETAAMKGELLAAKVISRGSKILESVSTSLTGTIRPALESNVEASVAQSGPQVVDLSEDVQQKIVSIKYQEEFARSVIDASSDIMRLLVAGQWPDLLSQEDSAELGSVLGHSMVELDFLLGNILQSVKEEGGLSPEHVNIGALQQTIVSTMQSLQTDITRDKSLLVPLDWNPPGWELMKHTAMAKFCCQAAAAALSLAVFESDDNSSSPGLISLYSKVEKMATQADSVCLRLCSLDVKNDDLVRDLSTLGVDWSTAASALTDMVNQILSSKGDVCTCSGPADKVLQILGKFSSVLRSANLNPPDDRIQYHALSPEVHHSWSAIANLCRSVRAVDGDEDDVNYLARGRTIEHQLSDAVENEAKLGQANTKVTNLEKSLATRTKEISMQAARLSELERAIAKGTVSPMSHSMDLKSSEEYNKLAEDFRVVKAASDHWERLADEYLREIQMLKDVMSPGGKTAKNRTPRRGMPSVSDMSPYGQSVPDNNQNVGVLEATLFRPALQQALRDASKWKAAAITSHLEDLVPLPIHMQTSSVGAEASRNTADSLIELSSALSNFRIIKASTKLIDLKSTEKSPRAQLRDMYRSQAAASERLQAIVMRCTTLVA